MSNVINLSKIATDQDFLKRVEYHMCEKALLVAASDPTAADQALIQKILNGSEPARMWAIAALTNPTIAAGTHSGDGSTVSDGDLQYQVHSQWAAFRI